MSEHVFLYVPLNNPHFVSKAASRGADVVILDLEDGVPEGMKDAARNALADAVAILGEQGQAITVRVNAPWMHLWRDLEACVAAVARSVILPKVESSHQVVTVAEYLSELEVHYKCQHKLRVLLLIETAEGLANAREILAASNRVEAVIPGNEDLARSYGVHPDIEVMTLIQQPLIRAAHARGVHLIGSIGSVAVYKDLESFKQQVKAARDWGFRGATCIHPTQIPVVRQVYAATDDVAWAERVVAAFAASKGAPTQVDGQMVDRPVFLRAQSVLQKFEAKGGNADADA